MLLESYDDAMLSRKLKVEDELRIAEERVNRENGKLIRMLNLGVLHKTKTQHAAPSGGMMRPPLSAPSTGMRTWNNPLANGSNNTIDEAFVEKITNFSERQRGIKQKERRIGERESRLKQKFIKLNEKEAESKLQEERISKLGPILVDRLGAFRDAIIGITTIETRINTMFLWIIPLIRYIQRIE